MAQKHPEIMDPDDKETFVYYMDTFQLHYVSIEPGTWNIFEYPLKEFSLLDDTSVMCRPRVTHTMGINVKYNFEIEFITQVPRANKYEISVYYFDKFNQLNLFRLLNAENIRQGDKFVFACGGAFSLVGGQYVHEVDGNVILCSKISRKDALHVSQKKLVHFRSSQITDCSLLFENAALSNLTISVENREFKVHKEILAGKSSVFLAMFETEMKEKKENYVKIEDIEANIFREFLRYIYTITVNDIYTHAEKLYKAADKYDLPKLKLICIDELSRSLSVENAIDVLLFADENNETIFKEENMDFIKKHMELIFQTEGYKALRQSPKAYLIDDIFRATFEYICALK